jgi:hypothetical protein
MGLQTGVRGGVAGILLEPIFRRACSAIIRIR